MKLSLVNLVPLEEMDMNDPVMMRARASQMKADKEAKRKVNRIDGNEAMYLRGEIADLKDEIKQIYIDMEQEAEPEGGSIADMYGDLLNKAEAKLADMQSKLDDYDMNEAVTKDYTIVTYGGKRLSVNNKDIPRLKSGKDVVGKSLKHAGQEEWILAKGKWKIEEPLNEYSSEGEDWDDDEIEIERDGNIISVKISVGDEVRYKGHKGKVLKTEYDGVRVNFPTIGKSGMTMHFYYEDLYSKEGYYQAVDESLNEEMGEWPKELTSRHSDGYRFELEKITPTYQDKPGRAKYRVIDIETGELKGTPVFGKIKHLMAYAGDLIKPQGGTQSSNFGESLEKMMNESEDKWNAIDVSRKAEKEIGNKEWNERTTKKLDMLIALNKAGKFKKDFDEERLQGWVDQNYSWEKLSRQFKVNEGSCGYGPNGKPGNTPGGTRGMSADDRTRGMFRKLIQKEIAKLSENDNFDYRLKSMMGNDAFNKATNPKLAKLINTAIMSIDPNMSYREFAKGVAQVLIDDYGVQNYEPFIKELKNALDSTLG